VRRRPGTAATFARYLAFQLPGTALAAAVLSALVRWEYLTKSVGLIFFGVWVVGEIAMFPVLRIAYESGENKTGVDPMLGVTTVARDGLDPEGWVQIGAERWRARVADGGAPIAAGATVRVVAVQQLMLVVELAEPDSDRADD
jgi:membrane-bound ClpP family serine protease